MLTKNEITALNLSPTKKDFVQIWNELLDVAGKLSERWDPTSTNESDPGIVLLKALTGIADKLNYNIDKNTLEAFMPTAAQEDSMRKLCDMLGYNIKYYQSAQTEVTIKYHNPDPSEEELKAITTSNNGFGLIIPKFTVITNNDKDVNYFIINDPLHRAPRYISKNAPVQTFVCMEGQVVKCESSSDNYVITANQISSDRRFYLPETQVAENGIFIYNVRSDANNNLVDNDDEGETWTKVDNLNTQVKGSKVYKFGFDSYAARPYLEFPDDYSTLFGEGLFIYYTRTNGVNGNISPRTLTQLELPNLDGWNDVDSESFSVENVFSATTGANIESIQQAYNNFKKTIGTFETLVTCRDYMNKIYTMVNNYNKPYVSNILVTDIRNDLNKAITICSCDDSGIFYKETPILTSITKSYPTVTELDTTVVDTVKIKSNYPFYNEASNSKQTKWHLKDANGIALPKSTLIPKNYSTFNALGPADEDVNGEPLIGTSEDGYYTITQGGVEYKTSLTAIESAEVPVKMSVHDTFEVETQEPAINHFDIVFYPYKTYSKIKNNVKNIREVYDTSFEYSTTNLAEITQALDASTIQTVAHNIISPKPGDLVSINNYLKLNATIATNIKVSEEECAIINNNIKIALANAFNMRELDFGEEIPFENIVEVIEKADSRIKTASLSEPDLYTTYTVIDSITNNTPTLLEYAVASDHFTSEDSKVNAKLKDTFNTEAAKKWYNKLVVRNILAGRVPLFKYNKLFKTNFSEEAYRVSSDDLDPSIDYIPDELIEPTEENPFTIWTTENGDIYTGQLVTNKISGDPSTEDDEGPGTPGGPIVEGSQENTVVYKKIYTPDEYKNNVITAVNDNDITDIDTYCNIKADENGKITNVTLSDGEFVRFKAPNFTTEKTYPAYVNYHLDLAAETKKVAENAEAQNLFNILNSDWAEWSTENPKIKWEKVLEYFKKADRTSNKSYRKTFILSQKISKYVPTSLEDEVTSDPASSVADLKGPILIQLDNTPASEQASDAAEELLAQSGCVKLLNPYEEGKGFKATLEWKPSRGETVSTPTPNLEIYLNFDTGNPFITSVSTLNNILDSVDTYLNTYKDQGKLPKECDWTISFAFECVPLTKESCGTWETFIKEMLTDKTIFNEFTPVVENGTVLWRLYSNAAYQPGKYILEDAVLGSGKLLKFDKTYYDNLASYDTVLRGIFLVKSLGKDTEPTIILNNTEYKLGANEFLYIEYTPSSTTEDGTTQELAAVTEIHGPGTIIRPNGFEVGIMDSDVYKNLGNTPHKLVTFETADGTNRQIEMHSFGVNEQVEIRDFARVVLSKDFSQESSSIYIYKNFNGCEALENFTTDEADNPTRINNVYTLKDNEYIFYTDENQSEFAYFTTGTQVTLEGMVEIPPFDIVDINTIFDSGIQEIPWQRIYFSDGNDKISFQEYQYITLGAGDTIKNLDLVDSTLLGTTKEDYSEVWRFCNDSIEYTLATDPDNPVKLDAIKLDSSRPGSGWEATSVLELNVSKTNAQTLRDDSKISTGLILSNTTSGGEQATRSYIAPMRNQALSFKTNVTCQSAGSKLSINDVYANPDKASGFNLKIFNQNNPTLVKTSKGKVVPYEKEKPGIDFLSWTQSGGIRQLSKGNSDLWNSVSLERLKVNRQDEEPNLGFSFDNALLLSPSLIVGTYGVFCIYLNYTSAEAIENASTWLEVLPGTSHDDFKILNADNVWECAASTAAGDRLFLHNGINCICINKTAPFFIKTSEESQGVLYFDDLKLVDCTAKADKSGDLAVVRTLGLNLDQLGYLGLPEKTNVTTDEIRDQLKTNCIEKYNTSFSNLTTNESRTFNRSFSEFDMQPTIATLVNTLQKVKEDIDNLLEQYPNTGTAVNPVDNEYLKLLFTHYQRLNEELQKKKALLDALNNNKNTDELEQQLIDLLGSFKSVSDLQAQLLADLVELRNTALEKADGFTTEDIINSFDTAIENLTDDGKTDVVNKLKVASTDYVNENYNQQLAILANSIGTVVDSEERNNLLAILTYLQSENNLTTRASLAVKVSKLIDSINSVEIESILTSLDAASAANDRSLVLSWLYKLETAFSTTNIKAAISEIEFALENSQDEYLSNILSNLADYVSSNALKTLTSAIGTAITDAKGSVSLTAIVERVQAAADAFYTQQRNTLKAEIDEVLENIDTSYATALAKLTNSQNSQVETIISKLKTLTEDRDSKLRDIESFEVASLETIDTTLPFAEQAINTVWLAALQQDLAAGVNDICQFIIKRLKNLDKSFTSYTLTNPFKYKTVEEAIDFAAFENLLSQTMHLRQKFTQNSANQELISLLSSDLIVLPQDVSEAMSAFISNVTEYASTSTAEILEAGGDVNIESSLETAENLDTTAALVSLITMLTSTEMSITKRQQVLKTLKEELNVAIESDSQLIKIVSRIACPNANLIDELLADSTIDWQNFKNVLKEIKNNFLAQLNGTAQNKVTAALTSLRDKLDSTNSNSITHILAVLLDEVDSTDSLLIKWFSECAYDTLQEIAILPDSFKNKIMNLKSASDKYAEILSLQADIFIPSLTSTTISNWIAEHTVYDEVSDTDILDLSCTSQVEPILRSFIKELSVIENIETASAELIDLFSITKIEEQLLAEIRDKDINRDFYYNVSIDPYLAIDFNESSSELNTLKNPRTNYDVNNVNNSFVISKLDIDYLDSGIRIARSSVI